MGITFTETQRKVIDTRGCNLLVSAAAGSGKTAVLVERIVELVCGGEHPVDIDRLLVVTFTNAAAAQMRERISRALSSRLALDPANEHLQRQTTLLYNAQITTIDSFCLFVLRNQFHTIGLDPGFRIADEGEMRLLRADVLSKVLEEAYRTADPAFLNCVEYFSVGSRDEAVEKEVLKLYDFAMSMPFPERWLEERKRDYCPDAFWGRAQPGAAKEASGGAADLLVFPWAETFLGHVRLVLAGCLDKLAAAVRLCEEPDGPYFYAPLLEREIEMTGNLLRLCGGSGDVCGKSGEVCGGSGDACGKSGEVCGGDGDACGKSGEVCGGSGDTCGKSGEVYGGSGDTCGKSGEVCGGDGDACGKSGEVCGGNGDACEKGEVCGEAGGVCGETETSGYDTICGAFGAVVFERLPSKRDPSVSPAKREAAKGLRGSVKESLSELRALFFGTCAEQVYRQMEGCQAAVAALVDLTLAFKAAFDGAKREKNILDFDDIEHFALQVFLRPEGEQYVPTETALSYRSRFHEILIDEYQDSNLVQEYLLSAISGEAEGRYNRFMVGDVKQSIYKFRLARPELFLEKHEAYGQADGHAMRIDLHQNFRSRREVLDSVNAVFERIMGKEAGGIVYDEKAALYPGAVYPCREESGDEDASNVTELLLIRTEDAPEEISAKEQEAYAVASRIKALLRDFQVTDKETGTLRKAAFRDIVILLRSLSGWGEVFKKVLEEEGIPVHVTSRTGYFAAPEVQELLHFLRILDNPLQDIPLYGVLHTYLGGFSEEEIALVRAAYPKKKYLYDAFLACAGEGADGGSSLIGERLRQKIRAFLTKVEDYRALSVYCSVHELLQTILRESGYLYHVAARPEGSRRRANVEMLLVKAADYEKTSYFGLYHFLRYMEQLEKYEVDYGEAAIQDENADVVRIMSIHKSKGLEFPVCIVAGLAASFGKKESGGILAVDVDAGIGVDYIDPAARVKEKNLRKNAIVVKRKRDNLAEELRILYVAMTRAEEKLILTGIVKKPEKTAAELAPLRRRERKLLSYDVLMEQDSFLTLLLSALSGNKCLDGFYEACSMAPEPENPEYAQEVAFSVKLTNWDDVVGKKIQETVLGREAQRRLLFSEQGEEADEALMAKLSSRFAYRYPHENLQKLYTKTTVSELKMAGMQEKTDFAAKLYEEEKAVPYLPGFLKGDERVSGSMRGSAFHKVMELLDFKKLTNEVNGDQSAAEAFLREEIAGMRREGRLSDEYYGAVSVPKLAGFLTSRTALRMAEAARAGKLFKEQPFVMGLSASRLGNDFPPEETVLIQGIIDVFFEEEDGYVVLDYKTDAVDTAEELVKRYQVQLDYYSEALEQISGDPSEGGKPVKERIIYSFRLGEEIHVVAKDDGATRIRL